MAWQYQIRTRICNTNKLRTILITGCAGFIGYNLALSILSGNSKYKLIGIDNLNNLTGLKIKRDRLKNLIKFKNFSYYKISITDFKKFEEIFKNFNISIVINFAALAGVRNSNIFPKKYFDSNVNGFYNAIFLAKKYKVKKFIYASSSSVYGDVAVFPTHEKISITTQKSFYAMTKNINEILSTYISSETKMKIIGLRFFTVYGEYGRPDMFLKNIVSAIIEKKTFNIYAFGKHERDFTYIGDVVKILNYILFKKSKSLKNSLIYNIGSGRKIQLMDLINIIEDNLSMKGKFKFIKRQKGDVLKTHSNNNLIQKDYKKINFTDIKKGIKNYVKWHKNYYY